MCGSIREFGLSKPKIGSFTAMQRTGVSSPNSVQESGMQIDARKHFTVDELAGVIHTVPPFGENESGFEISSRALRVLCSLDGGRSREGSVKQILESVPLRDEHGNVLQFGLSMPVDKEKL
jgi:hypothetical protein